MAPQSEQDLAQMAQQGDPEAFSELVCIYQDSVFRLCFRLLGDRQDAEDLAQEAFIRSFRHREKYDPSRPFGPWVRRIAANLCLNYLQARQTLAVPLEDELQLSPPAREPDPESIQEMAEQSQQVRAALLALPPHYRLVIELRHYQEQSYAEIADTLSLPLSDVKSYLFRARKQLAAWLNPLASGLTPPSHSTQHPEDDLSTTTR